MRPARRKQLHTVISLFLVSTFQHEAPIKCLQAFHLPVNTYSEKLYVSKLFIAFSFFSFYTTDELHSFNPHYYCAFPGKTYSQNIFSVSVFVPSTKIAQVAMISFTYFCLINILNNKIKIGISLMICKYLKL